MKANDATGLKLGTLFPIMKQRKQDRAITFLTQEEVQRLFDAIKSKRDRAIFAIAY